MHSKCSYNENLWCEVEQIYIIMNKAFVLTEYSLEKQEMLT